MQQPDYAVLARQLATAGAGARPAELHGVVCGLLCTAGRHAAADWLAEQLATFAGAEADVDAAAEALEVLEQSTWAALAGTELEFAPLLPDDDVELTDRTEALAEWCQGFVSGMGLGGWADSGPDMSEVGEVVRDLTAISHAAHGEADETDADAAEFSFVELAEYVRVGAQFIFESLVAASAEPASRTIH